jgi:hypothetical protein
MLKRLVYQGIASSWERKWHKCRAIEKLTVTAVGADQLSPVWHTPLHGREQTE